MGDSVENTPGRMAIQVMENVHKQLIFKKPSGLPRKRLKRKVLDEETYVQVLFVNSFPCLKILAVSFTGNRQDYST